ncbi:MAG: hypothetical protein RSD57_17380, partial [Comamonas sp.]
VPGQSSIGTAGQDCIGPNMRPENVKRLSVVMLLPPVLLLAACATSSPPSVVDSPKLPARPELTQPLSSQSYSSVARSNIESWQKQLTDTPATSGR